MMELLDRLVRSCLSIHVVPDLLQFMVLRSRVEDLDGLPTINLSDTRLDGWSRFVKRAFDLVVALAALLLLSPVMLLVAIAIWLEDRGPIFYRQMRMGLDGKSVRDPEVPLHARRRRGGDRRGVGGEGRSAAHARRRLHPLPGRSTSCRSSGTCWSAT